MDNSKKVSIDSQFAANRINKLATKAQSIQDAVATKSQVDTLPKETVTQNVEAERPKAMRASLKDLIFLGRVEKDVNIGGFEFKLSTLTNSKNREIVSSMMRYEPSERVLHIRHHTLAAALVSINDVPLENIDESFQNLSTLEARLAAIESLAPSIIDILFEEYDKMVSENQKVLRNTGEAKEEIKK